MLKIAIPEFSSEHGSHTLNSGSRICQSSLDDCDPIFSDYVPWGFFGTFPMASMEIVGFFRIESSEDVS